MAQDYRLSCAFNLELLKESRQQMNIEKQNIKDKAPCGRCETNNTSYCDPHHCKKYLKWRNAYRDRREQKGKQVDYK